MKRIDNFEPDQAARRTIGVILGDLPRHQQPLRGCINALCRLRDRAIIEYREMRGCAEQQIQGTTFSAVHFWRGISHLEGCVNALHRAVAIIHRARGLGFVGVNGEPLIPRPSASSLAHQTVARLREWRNDFEHLDMTLLDGTVESPILKSKAAEWRSRTLQYKELESWIAELHTLIEALSSTDAVRCRR
jgi:hypothetical protein